MSGLLAGKIWISDLQSELKPLAATLADIANDDGSSIYPSIEYVAWRLGVSKKTVDRGLAILRGMDVLQVIEQGGGRGNPTEYRMMEKYLPQRLSWREHKGRQIDVVSDKEGHPEQETTSSGAGNDVIAMTQDSSLPVRESLEGEPPKNPEGQDQPQGEECPKCGSREEGHKCPGFLSPKQREKRAGRSPGKKRIPAKRSPFETERAPVYQRPTYPAKKFEPASPAEPVKIDDDYPNL